MDYNEYVSKHYIEGLNSREDTFNTFPHRRFGNGDKELFESLIPYGSKVLDFGCGKGSMGYVGFSQEKGVYIDGLDRDVNNKLAIYHDMVEVKEHYDVVLFSSVIEHCTLDEIDKILYWAATISDRIIITLPNSHNPLMASLFFSLDLSHVRLYDSPDFLYFIEQHGYTIRDQIFYNDHPFIKRGFLWVRRMLSSIWNGTSPYGFVAIIADVKQ